MSGRSEESVWDAVDAGRHVVVVGAGAVGRPPDGRAIVHVRPAESATLGVLEEARVAIARRLGEPSVRAAKAMTLRRRILGEHWEAAPEQAFVDACARLRAAAPRCALVVERADTLDAGTVERMVALAPRVEVPWVLCYAWLDDGPSAALAEALIEDGALRVDMEGADPTIDLARLPADVRRLLRAAAVLGPELAARDLARMIDRPVLEVLHGLQDAVDLGAPIADRGDARFGIPHALVAPLRRGTLPSLVQRWHERLAGDVAAPVVVPHRVAVPRVESGSASAGPSLAEHLEPADPAPIDQLSEPFAAGELRSAAPAPRRAEAPRGADPARAAGHLEAAGRAAEAAIQLLEAAGVALDRGDPRHAHALASRARRIASELPPSDARDELLALALLREGEVLWHGASAEGGTTLGAALELLEQARAALPAGGSPHAQAEIARTIAGVCFDLGDLRHLERALVELGAASQLLAESGHALHAARLFNDQAAVFLRAGDPVRAAHLLRRARALFEGIVAEHPGDPLAHGELAETHHLLARLVLHAAIRPGHEADAHARALDHAKEAERLYTELEAPGELARVWETTGRLAHASGDLDAALAAFGRAFEVQRLTGDLLGLARTTAGMSDTLAAGERGGDALGALADSIELNARAGSPLGLAYNRRALDALTETLGGDERAAAEALRARLDEARARVGEVPLPPLA